MQILFCKKIPKEDSSYDEKGRDYFRKFCIFNDCGYCNHQSLGRDFRPCGGNPFCHGRSHPDSLDVYPLSGIRETANICYSMCCSIFCACFLYQRERKFPHVFWYLYGTIPPRHCLAGKKNCESFEKKEEEMNSDVLGVRILGIAIVFVCIIVIPAVSIYIEKKRGSK